MTLEYGDRVYCEHDGIKRGYGHIIGILNTGTYYTVLMENSDCRNGFPSKSVIPCWQQDFQERINDRMS